MKWMMVSYEGSCKYRALNSERYCPLERVWLVGKCNFKATPNLKYFLGNLIELPLGIVLSIIIKHKQRCSKGRVVLEERRVFITLSQLITEKTSDRSSQGFSSLTLPLSLSLYIYIYVCVWIYKFLTEGASSMLSISYPRRHIVRTNICIYIIINSK